MKVLGLLFLLITLNTFAAEAKQSVEPVATQGNDINNEIIKQQSINTVELSNINQKITLQNDDVKTVNQKLNAQDQSITSLEKQRSVYEEKFKYQDLRKELLDRQESSIDRWLAAAALLLTIFGFAIPIGTWIFNKSYLNKVERQREELEGLNIEAKATLEQIKCEHDSAGVVNKEHFDKLKNEITELETLHKKARIEFENMQQGYKSANNANSEYLEKLQAVKANLKTVSDEAEAILKKLEEYLSSTQTMHAETQTMYAEMENSSGLRMKDIPKPLVKDEDSSANTTELEHKKIKAYELIERNNFSDAINVWLEILQLSHEIKNIKEQAESHAILGQLFVKNKQFRLAIQECNKALELEPKSYDSYVTLCVAYGYLKEYEKALFACQTAIEIDSNGFDALYNMAAIHGFLKQYDKALETCQKAISLNPNSSHAHRNLAIIFAYLNQLDKALEASLKAVSLHPIEIGAFATLGGIYALLGMNDKAIKEIQEEIRINPYHIDSYLSLLGMQLITEQHLDDGFISKCRYEYKSKPDKMIELEMIEVYNDINKNSYVFIERDKQEFRRKYYGVNNMPPFSFNLFETWINSKPEACKQNLLDALAFFKQFSDD